MIEMSVFGNYRIFQRSLTVQMFNAIIYCKNLTGFSNFDYLKNPEYNRQSQLKKFLLKPSI